MRRGEEPEALALVMRGFDRFARPDFSEEGVAEFTQSAHSFVMGQSPGHIVSVAEGDGRLVGVIDVRDASHIACSSWSPRSWAAEASVAADAAAGPFRAWPWASLTGYSSPWAVPVYQALAFQKIGEECEQHGVRCVPMERRLRGEPSRAMLIGCHFSLRKATGGGPVARPAPALSRWRGR